MGLDEASPQVRALVYEATDKVNAVERIAVDAQEILRRLVTVLGEDEQVTARLKTAADAATAAANADTNPAAPQTDAPTPATPPANPPATPPVTPPVTPPARP